jgi:hypothetical protein
MSQGLQSGAKQDLSGKIFLYNVANMVRGIPDPT